MLFEKNHSKLFKRLTASLISLFMIMGIAHAQDITVTGKILDSSGEPAVGAYIMIEGTRIGTSADLDGSYSIKAPANARLVFTSLGYRDVVVDVNGRAVINVTLEIDATMLEDVVVVGFGTQKRETLTGAVGTIDVGKAIANRPISDLTQALQGAVPGLTITNNSGQLGNASSIKLRGAGTIINSAESGEPLVLVDGIPASLTLINPDDVQSVSVLKDGASASIYGSRAAFGVILVTTKSGANESKLKINYTGSVAFSNPISLTEFYDAEKELQVMIDAQARAGNNDAESFGMLYKTLLPGVINWKQKYANNRTSNEMVYGEDWDVIGGRYYFYRLWDPHKEMLNENSPQTNHSLQLSGKIGPNTTLLASLGYVFKEGVMKIKPEKYNRYNANINLNTKVTKWLDASFKVMASREDYQEPYNYYGSGYSGGGFNGYYGYYMRWGQFFPYGTYKGTHFRHAPGYMAQANYNDRLTDFLRLGTTLTAKITDEISFVAEYSFAKNSIDYKLNGGTVSLWDFWSGVGSNDPTQISTPYIVAPGTTHDRVMQARSSDQKQLFNSWLRYNKTFGEDHNFEAQLGTNIEWGKFERNYSERRYLLDRNKPEFSLAIGDQYSNTTTSRLYPTASDYAIAGFFGRVNYDYKGKYLASFTARYDGSSKFPTHTQWGFFPSASIGWRVSEENFMAGVKNIFNNIKLRASYGSIGNEHVRANSFIPVMSSTNANWIGAGGTTLSTTMNLPNTVSDALTWENVVDINFGIDLGLFNMFDIGFDLFQKEVNGMHAAGMVLPKTFGASAPMANTGNLRTRGWEFSLNFNKVINKNVYIFAGAGVSDATTKLVKWDSNVNKTLGSLYEGMILGEIWGLTTDRLFQKGDFDSDGKLVAGIADQSKVIRTSSFKLGPGDVKYVDLDNSGAIDNGSGTATNSGDLSVIGNSTPRYEYYFRLGGEFYGFDVNVYFQGVGKRDMWAASDLILPFYNRTDAMYAHMADYWTESNTDAFYPRPFPGHATNAFTGVVGSNNFARQTRYMMNLAYLRLKNMTVGYTIPAKVTRKANIDKVRLYVSGENLLTIKDKNLPVDPETNQTEAAWGRTFPYQRTISVGIQLNF